VDVYQTLQHVDVTDSGRDLRNRALETALGAPIGEVTTRFKAWLPEALQATGPLTWRR
jgi:hypothetical protein